jgi:hypothetical protein
LHVDTSIIGQAEAGSWLEQVITGASDRYVLNSWTGSSQKVWSADRSRAACH